MKKAYVLALCMLLALTSCPGPKPEGTTTVDVYKGTDGVVTEIVDKALPKEVFEDNDFSLVVKVTNKGPIPVSNARLLISPEKGYLSLDDGSTIRTDSISLMGKDQYSTINDFALKTYQVTAGKLDALSEGRTGLITVTTCYDYESKAHADICVDTDPLDVKPVKKVCTAQPVSLSGQGGPLAITGIEPKTIVYDDNMMLQIKINVENKGSGSVVRYGGTEKYCSGSQTAPEDYNLIDSSKLSISIAGTSIGFDCIPGELKLKNNQDYIICTLNEAIPKNADTYSTSIAVELKYGYAQTQSREIQINKMKR